MYLKLFNGITDAIEILQKAQIDGENAHILSSDEPMLISLKSSQKKSDTYESKE